MQQPLTLMARFHWADHGHEPVMAQSTFKIEDPVQTPDHKNKQTKKKTFSSVAYSPMVEVQKSRKDVQINKI